MPAGVFVFLAALALISSIGVIAQRNPVHCLLALILTLITIGALFIALDAVIVGLLQIIVYVGAIMVLFLFVVWLLNLQAEATPVGHLALKLFASVAVATMVADKHICPSSIFFHSRQNSPSRGMSPRADIGSLGAAR